MHSERKFGPKKEDNPSIDDECPVCLEKFKVGDYTTLVAIGPGADKEQQERARLGRPYNAVALEAHWACVTGELEPIDPPKLTVIKGGSKNDE